MTVKTQSDRTLKIGKKSKFLMYNKKIGRTHNIFVSVHFRMSRQLIQKESAVERFALHKPDKNVMNFYQQLRDVFWNPQELSFESDRKDYLNPAISNRYKELYRLFLEFFAVGDGVITEQAIAFLKSANTQEERMFLSAQLLNEQDHIITYTRAINEVIPTETEREAIFSAVESNPAVKAKTDYVLKWCENENVSRSLRYLAGAFAEGVFFMSLFAIIFYFRRKNIFVNFISANKLILRDETIHRNFDVYMSRGVSDDRNRDYTVEDALQVAREAYEIEIAHMNQILARPVDSEEADEIAGLTKEKMRLYIQTLVDQILTLAGLPGIFNVPPMTTFQWMEDINLIVKKNFYETLVTEYTSGILTEKKEEEDDEDF